MIKILRSVKLYEAIGLVPFGNQRNFLHPIFSQTGQYVALLRVNCEIMRCTVWGIIGQLLEWDFGLTI